MIIVRHKVRAAAACAVLCAAIVIPASRAPAASTVSATFKINGRVVNGSSGSDPIALDPDHPAQVEMTVTNRGSSPVLVSTITVSGRALNIPFFDFETQTALEVQPGGTETQAFTLDFAPLKGQGDGLIPATIRILGPHRAVVASTGFVADVKGRLTSLFGLFGIEVALCTAALLAGAILALSRGRLPENRFRRAVRFLWPGIGTGIVIVFTLAVLRIFVPSPLHWLPIVLVCAVIGLAVGYLTPTPTAGEEYAPPPPGPPPPGPPMWPAGFDPRMTAAAPATTAPPAAPVTRGGP